MFIYHPLQQLLKMSAPYINADLVPLQNELPNTFSGKIVEKKIHEFLLMDFLQSSLKRLLSLRRDPSLTPPAFSKLMTSCSPR